MVFTCRHFNKVELSSDGQSVIKTSIHSLDGEIYYYMNIPESVKNMFPNFIWSSDDMNSYKVEYIHGHTFSELFVQEKLTIYDFEGMLKQLCQLHSIVPPYKDELNIYANYDIKLRERYTTYANVYNQYDNCGTIYTKLQTQLIEYETLDSGKLGMIHGDPVFTNIILDSNGNIRFIDMKGKLHNQQNLYGDIAYDWAKIYQSLCGYDAILHDCAINDEYVKSFMDVFWKHCPFNQHTIKMITASLFFSLIPLHLTNRNMFYHLCMKHVN